MIRSKILGVRLTDPEREHVRELAQRAERTESDFVRLLLLRVDPEHVNPGISSATLLEVEASERQAAVA